MSTTARVTGLDLADDGVLIVRATCETCRYTVLHGAGTDLDAPVLGTRLVHCKCREDEPGAVYTLTDPHDVVRKRLRVIRSQLPEFRVHQANVAHRERIEEARARLLQVNAETKGLPVRDPERLALRQEARAAVVAAEIAVPRVSEAVR